MSLHEDFYHSDKSAMFGDYGYDEYNDDDYDFDDDYGYDDDEIGYLNGDLWEYEAEFDRAAREIERSRRSPAAKILMGLIVIAAALAIWLGISEYAGGDSSAEPEIRTSFVWADGEGIMEDAAMTVF
ncbi:MAG: hypothetical protein LUE29_06185 [Lachnospiraceae bacterium]|nr:hypothetical protein [Lachnospiraceae bacterium]